MHYQSNSSTPSAPRCTPTATWVQSVSQPHTPCPAQQVSHGAIQFAVYEELKVAALGFSIGSLAPFTRSLDSGTSSSSSSSGGGKKGAAGQARELSHAEITACGALSKLVASTATYPTQASAQGCRAAPLPAPLRPAASSGAIGLLHIQLPRPVYAASCLLRPLAAQTGLHALFAAAAGCAQPAAAAHGCTSAAVHGCGGCSAQDDAGGQGRGWVATAGGWRAAVAPAPCSGHASCETSFPPSMMRPHLHPHMHPPHPAAGGPRRLLQGDSAQPGAGHAAERTHLPRLRVSDAPAAAAPTTAGASSGSSGRGRTVSC